MNDFLLVTIQNGVVDRIFNCKHAEELEQAFIQICKKHGHTADLIEIEDGYAEIPGIGTVCMSSSEQWGQTSTD